MVQSFQSVVDKLRFLRTHDQYNAFVIEAKTIWSNFDIFIDVLGPAEFPKKRTKKMPLQIDESVRGISLSEEEKYRKIYFETLDNMIGELNERMNGFSKVLDLFYFLNPEELKKLNIEDVKKKCEALVLQYNYFTVNELSLEIMSFQSYYFVSKESESADNNILSYLVFIIKHSLSDVLPQMENLLKIFLTLTIGSASAERAMSVLRRLKSYLRSSMVQDRTSNLALLSMKYEAAQDLDMTELIDKFSKAKVRRGSQL